MSLLYSAIVADGSILAEFNSSEWPTKQLSTVALSIAAQATPRDQATFVVDKLSGDYLITSQNQTIVVLTAENTPKRVTFRFLSVVANELNTGKPPAKALEDGHAYVQENRDAISEAQSEIADVRKIMLKNIDQLLERGERINLLVDRTGEMSINAQQFRRQATSVQRHFWYQNIRNTVLFISTMIIFGVLVVHFIL